MGLNKKTVTNWTEWETSHMLALHPQLVGIMESMAPQDATAEFGRRTLEESAEVVLKEVAHRLAHQDLYRQHGESLQEGLWKDQPPTNGGQHGY